MRHLIFFVFIPLLVACSRHHEENKSVEKSFLIYQEPYRPQFHFSPEAHWMNDPNGMVYYGGEYHLFYQYYPDSTVWGPMHWGHAVSIDLVHWEHLPIALYPDSLGYIFSGSAVIDWNNTTGFGTKENLPMVAIFTYHNIDREKQGRVDTENQGIAYSLDKGRTWTKYANNPVLKNPGIRDFRDPKVSWNEEAKKWIMVLAAHDRVNYYSSPDLKNWTFESDFGTGVGAHGGVWECPDLFPLKVEGSGETKWVQMVSINPGGPNGGSATQYFVGNFDGKTFISESIGTNWVDWGRDDYAGVTWSDIPNEDGRRLFLGWMSNWNYANVVPTTTWRSAMTVPRELKLRELDGKYWITSIPVKELKELRDSSILINYPEMQISGEQEFDVKNINLNQCELELNFQTGHFSADSLGLLLKNELGEFVKIGYSVKSKQFFVDRTKSGDMSFSEKFSGIDVAPYSVGEQLKLHLFIDAASVELFVDNGNLVMTNCFFPTENFTKLILFADKGELIYKHGSLTKLKSIWGK